MKTLRRLCWIFPLAAALNWPVGWAVQIFGEYPRTYFAPLPEPLRWPGFAPASWPALREFVSPQERERYQRLVGEEFTTFVFPDRDAAWATAQATRGVGMGVEMRTLAAVRFPRDDGDGAQSVAHYWLAEDCYGVPLRGVANRRASGARETGERGKAGGAGGENDSEWESPVWSVRLRGQMHGLALTPLWWGVAGNTVVYASLLLAVFAAPGWVRRARRRREGKCVGCGYDVRGVERCPECGKEVRANQR